MEKEIIPQELYQQLFNQADVSDALKYLVTIKNKGKMPYVNEETPLLHELIRDNNREMIDFMLGVFPESINLRQNDEHGFTPLHAAIELEIESMEFYITTLLIKNGAEKNALTNGGDTALHLLFVFII